MFHIAGANVSYEILGWLRTDANEGKRIEIKLSSGNTWYLDFKSLFKIFQFLEQLRIFQYKNIDFRSNPALNESSLSN
jgi:hypothetical protein